MEERKLIEAILMVAEEPVPSRLIGEVLERPRAEVEGLLRELAAAYAEEDRGFVLREAAGGWRLYSSPEAAPWLETFVRTHGRARLTGAAMEVLAIVAYRGPVSRSEIAEIRGVDSDGVVRTLVTRELIEEARHEGGPGAPTLFQVSPTFMARMGLNSLDELPPLAEFMPDSEAVEDMEAKLSPGV